MSWRSVKSPPAGPLPFGFGVSSSKRALEDALSLLPSPSPTLIVHRPPVPEYMTVAQALARVKALVDNTSSKISPEDVGRAAVALAEALDFSLYSIVSEVSCVVVDVLSFLSQLGKQAAYTPVQLSRVWGCLLSALSSCSSSCVVTGGGGSVCATPRFGPLVLPLLNTLTTLLGEHGDKVQPLYEEIFITIHRTLWLCWPAGLCDVRAAIAAAVVAWVSKAGGSLKELKARLFECMYRLVMLECGLLAPAEGWCTLTGSLPPAKQCARAPDCVSLPHALSSLRPLFTDAAALFSPHAEDFLNCLHSLLMQPPPQQAHGAVRLLRPAECSPTSASQSSPPPLPPPSSPRSSTLLTSPPRPPGLSPAAPEFSDEGTKQKGSLKANVRLAALQCILAVAKAAPKAAHAKWALFLPESNPLAPRPPSPSLITLALHDPAPKVREAALSALASVLDAIPFDKLVPLVSSKAHCSSPVGGSGPARAPRPVHLRTLGERIVDVLLHLHVSLLAVLENGPPVTILAAALKAVNVLLKQCPYDRLVECCEAVPPLVLAAGAVLIPAGMDVPTRTAALHTLGTVVGIQAPAIVARVSDLLPPILDSTLTLLTPLKDANVAVAGDGFLLIGKSAQLYSAAVLACWGTLEPLLLSSPSDEREQVRSASIRVVEHLVETGRIVGSALVSLLVRGTRDASPHVRCAGWDALAILPPDLALTALLTGGATGDLAVPSALSSSGLFAAALDTVAAACKDPTSTVRAAASKLLGTFASKRVVKIPEFVLPSVRELCVLLKDPAPAVRIRAVWAIGVFASNSTQTESEGDAPPAPPPVFSTGGDNWGRQWHVKEVNDTFLLRMLPLDVLAIVSRVLIDCLADTDKVSSAAVRALARCSSALFVHASLTSHHSPVSPLAASAARESNAALACSLIHNIAACTDSPHPKLRWNACHAIGTVLPWACTAVASVIPPHLSPSALTWNIVSFRGLIVCLDSDNFKVRIAASAALQNVWHRQALETCYEEVVKGLVSGLFSVDFSVSEFREYHYEESLKSSLLLALANVLYLGLETDFEDGSLRAFLLENVDVVNRVLSFTEGTVSRPDSGLSVVQRIMAFYS